MFEKEIDLGITDLIDMDFLQGFQEIFQKSMNIASLVVDANGPITKPSLFNDFCDLTRSTSEGYKRCNACDLKGGEQAVKKGEQVFYKCHAGLIDFAVPIMAEGKHYATFLGGQVLHESPDEESFRKVANEIGVDEEEYIQALRKIEVIPEEKLKAAAQLVHMGANALSKMAHDHLKLIERRQMETIYREITEAIRYSLDINETKQQIVNIIGKTLNADRCFIVDYDNKTDKFLTVQDEYLSSDKIIQFKETDVNDEIPEFSAMIKRGEQIIINNKEVVPTRENQNFNKEKIAIEKHNVKSAFAFPLYSGKELIGALAVHYVLENHLVTEEEIGLLKEVAAQISIALHQARLYAQLNQKLEDEKVILNNMPYMAWIKDRDCKYVTVNEQFCRNCNQKIEDILGKTDYDISLNNLADKYREDDLEVMNTGLQKVTEEKFINGQGLGWSKTYKSPFFDDKGEVLGTVGLSRDITEERNAKQELLLKQKQLVGALERESLLGKVITKAISTLDVSQIKHIVKDVCLLTKADRCYFLQSDLGGKNGKIIDLEAEYIASPKIKSIVGYEFSDEQAQCFIDLFLEKKEPIVFDYEEILQGQDDDAQTGIREYAKNFDLKSGIGIPFSYMNKPTAVIAIEYINKKVLPSSEDLNFLGILGNQIGMVFQQIQTYKYMQKIAEREKINRKIVEVLSSTLDKNLIKHLFVKNIGEFFNADRVLFVDYDPVKGIFLPAEENAEYLPNNNYKSFMGYEWIDESIAEFIQPLKEKKEVNVFCFQEHIKSNQKSQGFISLFADADVKSSYNIPVSNKDKLVGFFSMEFTQRVCKLSDEELEFLRSISTQAAIALSHADLYLQAQESARAKGDFIANMSHEIKTPLNIIMGFSDVLTEADIERNKQVEYLNNIKNSGKHLLNLANDIIHISKMEAGSLGLKYENIDSESLIKGVVGSIKLESDTKKISVEISLVKANVVADEKMFTQILYNLLSNAIKFTPENGRVKIRSKLDSNKLVISIEDTEIGISRENQDKIFEKFKQVDSSYSKMHQGAGLGLSITKKLVELHNGSLHVDSIKGKGSRFWFILPNAKKIDPTEQPIQLGQG